MIWYLIIAVGIAGGLFVFLPGVVELLLEAYDEWVDIVYEIQNRRQNHD